jgi:cobalt/nickel transport system ATP-binding protein
MSENAIKVENVSYAYPNGFIALKKVELEITRGEKLAILGPNGAGKSTLLMLLNGLYKPCEGKVTVFGTSTNDENIEKVRRDVGLVFQDPDDQLFSPTLWEDVSYGPRNMRLSEDEVKKRSNEALRAVGLEGYEEKPPHHLSAGEKKKATIATVLAMRPKILALDEPTANLDPKSRHELIHLLHELHDTQQATLVIATHDVNLIPEIAERVCILNGGRVTSDNSARTVFSDQEILAEANLEPPIIAQLFLKLAERNKFRIAPIPLTIDDALSQLDMLDRMRHG